MNVLSLSYGKDSLACFGACEQLGIKIDRIVHAEVWATDTIPADLPPMVEFKKHADKIIKERYGIEVEHICALKNARVGGGKRTYENIFYQTLEKGRYAGSIYGFPATLGAWCRKLKMETSGVDIRRYVLSSQQSKEPNTRVSNFGKQRKLVYEAETTPFTNCSSRERERERRVHKSFKFLELPQTNRNALSDTLNVTM